MKVNPSAIGDIEFIIGTMSQIPADKLHSLDQHDRKAVKIFMETLFTLTPNFLSQDLKNRVSELKPLKQSIFTRILNWIQNIFFSRIGINDLPIRLIPRKELDEIFRLPLLPGHKLDLRKELIARGYAPIINAMDFNSVKMRRIDFANVIFNRSGMNNVEFVDCNIDGALFNQCKFVKVVLPNFNFAAITFHNCIVNGKENNLRELHPYHES